MRDEGIVDLAAWRAGREGRSEDAASGLDTASERTGEDGARDDAGDVARAIDRVLRRLASRAMTASEVDRALRDAGVMDGEERAVLLEDWRERGYVDDAAVASGMVERLGRRPTGRGAIERRLRERGVGADDAAEAMSGLDPQREAEAAIAFATAKADRAIGPVDEALVRRIAGQLQRRGFSPAAQRRALDLVRARAAPDRWSADRSSGPRFSRT